MPNNIDTRIVEMEFDNAQFERGAKQTLKTLDTLNQSLSFENVAKGAKNLESAFNKLDFTSITNNIDLVGKSFTGLEAVAFGVSERIGNKIADLGMNIANELLIAQKKAGFAEYELELGSVQTIQASTGKDFKEIYGYLAELNKYADQTIYSFRDMTSSIGKFTNAGVDLDVAVKAIQGISNEAALSGANAEEASRAMYNFSQALSAGYVKLIDWKSIENANMATVGFKQQLLDTALELGTVVKKGDKYISTTTDMNGKISAAFDATANFNDSLSAQWMTSEVLTKALAKYSDETTDIGKRAYSAAQDVKSFSQMIDTLKEAIGSGWAETFRLIFGEFEDAKKLWTGVSNVLGRIIDRFSDARNHMLRFWKQEGGRTKLLNSLIRLWKIFEERVQVIGDVFIKTFPIFDKTGHVLMNLTKRFQRFTIDLKKQFLGNEERLASFRNKTEKIFNGLKILITAARNDILPIILSVFSIVDEAVSKTFDSFEVFDDILTPIINKISEFTSALADMYWNFDSGEPMFAILVDVLGSLLSVLKIGRNVIIGFLSALTNNVGAVYWITDAFRSLVEIAKAVGKQILEAFIDVFDLDVDNWLEQVTENLAMFLRWVSKGVKNTTLVQRSFKLIFTVVKALWTILKAVIKGLSQALNPFDNGEQKGMYNFIDALVEIIEKFMEFITESKIIEKAMKGVGEGFKAFGDFVKGLTGNSVLQNIIGFFDGLTKSVTSGKIQKGFNDLIEDVLGGIDKVWGAITGTNVGDGKDLGPLTKKFHDLQNGISDGSMTAETFGETLSSSIGDAKDKLEDDMDNIRLFFESLSETINQTRKDVELIAQYFGGGLAQAIVWVGSWVMTESDLKGLEETDSTLGKIWRWLENVAELEDQKGPKTLGVGNLIDKVTELYDGLKDLLPTVKDVAEITMIFNTGIGIKDLGKGIKEFATGITGIGKGFLQLSKGLSKAGKIWAKSQKTLANATFLTSFAAFLLVILAWIVIITQIIENSEDNGKALGTAVSIMVGIIGFLVVCVGLLLKTLNDFSENNERFITALGGLAKLILAMGISILLLAASFAIITSAINKVPWYVSLSAFLMIAVFMAAMFGMLAYMMDIMRGVAFQKATTEKTSKMLEGFAKVLTAFASSVLLMAVAFGLITYIVSKTLGAGEVGVFAASVGLIAGFMLLLVLLVKTLTKVQPSAYSSAFIGISKMFTSISAAMISIAVAIGLIAGVFKEHYDHWEIVGLAIGTIGVLLLIMAGMTTILSKMPTNQARNFDNAAKLFNSMTFLIIGFAISLGIMAEVLRRAQKNNVSAKELFGMMGMILALMTIVGLIATFGGGKASTNMVVIAVAMGLMAGSFILFAKGLQMIADVNSSGLNSVLKVLGKQFWNILKGAFAFTVAAVGISLLGGAFLILALGLGALALVLTPFMPLLEKFVDNMSNAGDSIEKGTDKLTGSVGGKGLGASIGEKLGAGLRDLVKSLKKYAPEIINDVIYIISLLVKAFFIPLQGVGKGIIDTLVVSLNYINSHIDDILTPLGEIIGKINAWLKLYAPVIAETVALLIFYIFNSAFIVLAKYAGILAESLYNAIASLLEAFGDQLTGEKNARIAAAIAKIVDGLFDLIKKTFTALSQTEMAEAGANLIDAMVEGIKAAPNKLKKAINEALGKEIFDVGEDLDLSLHDGEIGWRIKDGQWQYDDALAEIQQQQKEAERIRSMTEDTLAGGGGSSTTVNSPYDTSQMDAANKEAAEYAEEVTKTVTDTAQEELEKETDKNIKIPGWGDKVAGALTDEASNVDFTAMSKQLKDTFDVTKFIPNSEEMTSGFTNSFGGMPDISTMMTNAGVDTSVELEPVYNMDNAKIMQDGQLSDFEGFDSTMLMGETSTDYSQTVSQTQNTEFNDETKATYEKLKAAVDDLTAMLSNVTIISDDATISASVDLDGEKVGELMVPVVDAKLTQGGKKAKTKTAQ